MNIRDRGFWLAGLLALAGVVFLIDLFTPIGVMVRLLYLCLIAAVAWLSREIAERKSSEEAVRQSEERLRLALDAGRIGLFEWQIATNRAVWNARQYELLGLPNGSGEPGVDLFFRHVHPDDLPGLRQDLTEGLTGSRGDDFFQEFRIVRPDGLVRWLASAGRLYRECGRPLRMVGVNFDVTERRELREQLKQQVAERTRSLQESNARLHAILFTAADAIISCDCYGRIELVNPAAERMFGYAAAQMIGHSVQMLMPAEHGGLGRYLPDSNGKGDHGEVQVRRKDGSLLPVELAVSEVRHEGQCWYTGILHDLTRRKALESEVLEIAAREQQRIGQELHDGVGQELTGLGLMADALTRQLRRSQSQESGVRSQESGVRGQGTAESAASSLTPEKLAAKITRGLERLHQQVRGLSRGLVPVQVDAEGLQTALEELAGRTSEQSGIECVFDCPEPVPVACPTVATHLYRIAQEAVSNALRHGRAPRIRIGLRDGAVGLCLSVEDAGVGMPGPPDEERGVGIRIMRYRAGMIGGRLEIEAAEGGGTLVRCAVPWRSHDHEP